MAKRTPARRARPTKRKTRKTSARKAARPRATAGRKRKAAAKRPKARRVARRAAPARGKKPPKSAARPKPVALSRERRQLRDADEIPSPPSTLGFARKASSAESGHDRYHQRRLEHTEGGSRLTGGEFDTDWNDAYASGEEAPGGDMPTPDQDVVEEIGRALGVEYEDAEELKGAEKIEDRDRRRWEYDPASAEDYRDRNRRDE